jgi:hypothetical protein
MILVRRDVIAPHTRDGIVISISRQPPYARVRKRQRLSPTIEFPAHNMISLAHPTTGRWTYEYSVQNVPSSGPADEILSFQVSVILSVFSGQLQWQ